MHAIFAETHLRKRQAAVRRPLVISQRRVTGGSVLASLILAYVLVRHSTTDALALALVPGAVWVITRPYGGIALGIVLMLLLPAWQTFGSAQLDVARLASLCGASAILFARGLRLRGPDLAVAAFVLAAFLSWQLSGNMSHAGRVLTVEFTPIGFYIGARALSRHGRDFALKCVFFAATGGALTVIYEYIRGAPVFLDPLQYQWNATDATLFRPGGIFGSPPAASTVLCFAILFGVATFVRAPKGWRPIWLACLAICTAGLILTFTRTAFIALAAGLILYLWLIRSRLLRPLTVIWIVATVAVAYFGLAPMLNTSSTLQEGILRGGTLSTRESYWQVAFPIITSDSSRLAFGVGSGSLEAPQQYSNVSVPAVLASRPQVVSNSLHSQYVTILVEQGIVGLLVVIAFLGSVCLPVIRTALQTRDRMVAAVAAGIVAILIVMATDTVFLVQPAFAMLMLSAGLAVGYAGRANAAPSVEA